MALRRPSPGRHNAQTTARRTGERGHLYRPLVGTAFVHTVIDDHFRMAHAEICTDEKAATAIEVLQRAVAWYADHGVTFERVLSDNGSEGGRDVPGDACSGQQEPGEVAQ